MRQRGPLSTNDIESVAQGHGCIVEALMLGSSCSRAIACAPTLASSTGKNSTSSWVWCETSSEV